MADENETKISAPVGLSGTESPAKSPVDVLLMSFDREAFIRNTPIPYVWSGTSVAAFLYIMECGRFVKVGIASDPDRRRATLQSSNPAPVLLRRRFHFLERKYAWIAEQECHRLLNPHQAFGEWFALPLSDATKVARRVVGATQAMFREHNATKAHAARAERLRQQDEADQSNLALLAEWQASKLVTQHLGNMGEPTS